MIKFSELNTAKSCEGLVPAIIQDDDTRQVLMLGYLNEEAFDKTVAEGRVTFFSRTKGRLWTKGETSGNYLHVKSIAKDCDGNYIDSSTLTVYMRRLRIKIEDNPSEPQMLLTVRGMGYKWNVIG